MPASIATIAPFGGEVAPIGKTLGQIQSQEFPVGFSRGPTRLERLHQQNL